MNSMVLHKKQTRVAFIIYAKSQVQTFLKSGSVDSLSKYIDLEIVSVGKWVYEKNMFTDTVKTEIGFPNIYIKKYSSLIQLLTLWKFRERSMNHKVRAMATFGSKKERVFWNCVVVSEMKISFFKRLLVKLFSITPIYHLLLFLEYFIRLIFLLPRWKSVFKSYDIIVIPYSGKLSAEFGSLVWVAKKLRKQSIAVQENWDNLSTKSFIIDEPDVFAVWGMQSKGHVRSVHSLFDTKVHMVGCARFRPYFQDKIGPAIVSTHTGDLKKLEVPYILIGGTGDGLDDEVLIKTSYEVLKSLNSQDEIIIVYRPHPDTRFSRDYQELSLAFPGIIIDSGPKSKEFGHHINLVKNCKVLINHFSTLSIEGLISNVHVCVPLFLGRPNAKYRYHHILNEWHHMIGLQLIPNLLTPLTHQEFFNQLNFAIQNECKKDNSNLSWICDQSDWVENMRKLIELSANHN